VLKQLNGERNRRRRIWWPVSTKWRGIKVVLKFNNQWKSRGMSIVYSNLFEKVKTYFAKLSILIGL
jgi:hypothetical protein